MGPVSGFKQCLYCFSVGWGCGASQWLLACRIGSEVKRGLYSLGLGLWGRSVAQILQDWRGAARLILHLRSAAFLFLVGGRMIRSFTLLLLVLLVAQIYFQSIHMEVSGLCATVQAGMSRHFFNNMAI